MNLVKLRLFVALLPPKPVQEYATQIKQHFADRYQSRAALKSLQTMESSGGV
ncbi:hypothetical protein [Leptolyngbya sp. 'hensonii']|uniref:hypothetical protein n=1 Tax=Leptolyngbya sp. 'hensonii' TaxID=1922337 RepID=UPI001C0D4197|nr:hypothetical protein [Leptolyngbya sp. 'hensonii']